MQQSNLSKLEAMEWSPRPETVQRLAEGIAAISGRSVEDEIYRLLDGVSSRFDAVQAQRASASHTPLDRLHELADNLPPDKRAEFNDSMAAHARRLLRALNKATRRGPHQTNAGSKK